MLRAIVLVCLALVTGAAQAGIIGAPRSELYGAAAVARTNETAGAMLAQNAEGTVLKAWQAQKAALGLADPEAPEWLVYGRNPGFDPRALEFDVFSRPSEFIDLAALYARGMDLARLGASGELYLVQKFWRPIAACKAEEIRFVVRFGYKLDAAGAATYEARSVETRAAFHNPCEGIGSSAG